MINLARERFHIRASSEMILTRLVSSMGLAVATVVVSLYLRDVGLSDSSIGFVTAVSSIVVALSMPLLPVLLERFNELKIYTVALIALGGVFAAMGYVTHVLLAIALYYLSRVFIGIYGNAASITFKDVSGSRKEFTKAQGLASSLMNVGWVVGPLLGGLILATYDMRTTFLAAGGFMVLAAAIIIVKPIKLRDKKRARFDTDWLDNVRFYISRKNLILAYLQRFGVTGWWAFLWTFIPLFMIEQGYSPGSIGFALALTQVPLVLFEFKTVEYIPHFGYRKIFFGSFAFMTVTVLLSLLSSNLYFVMSLLIIASLALCFLEPITEIFFYDQVTYYEEEKAEPIYATAHDTGSILTRLFGGVAIAISGETAAYLTLAIIMALIALSALRISPKAR